MPASPADNPLPPCPHSPNCVRTTRRVEAPSDVLFRAAQAALAELGPVELHVTPTERCAHAVYRVALVFNDDVDVAVTPDDAGSVLHLRSASRTGYWDLGVNRRRVRRFFRRLQQHL